MKNLALKNPNPRKSPLGPAHDGRWAVMEAERDCQEALVGYMPGEGWYAHAESGMGSPFIARGLNTLEEALSHAQYNGRGIERVRRLCRKYGITVPAPHDMEAGKNALRARLAARSK
jgi:hypothetical protein